MNRHSIRVRMLAALLLTVFVSSMAAPAAYAQDEVLMAHRAIRRKILHDAHDRYDVEFRSAHVDHMRRRTSIVTGAGRFRRRGKYSQDFTYHATVNTWTGRVEDVGYDIQ